MSKTAGFADLRLCDRKSLVIPFSSKRATVFREAAAGEKAVHRGLHLVERRTGSGERSGTGPRARWWGSLMRLTRAAQALNRSLRA